MGERRQLRHRLHSVTLGLLMMTLVPLLPAGCSVGSARKDPLEIEAQRLALEKAELMRDLQQNKAENAQLAEQIKALSALGPDRPLTPYQLTSVRTSRYTNFYDKNNDGKREKLIVYLQPVDTAGDTVKAAGTVNVQLWNLNNPNGQALLDQWQVEPDELHRMWIRSMISSNYRLTFETPDALDVLAEPLTLRVIFTDYLTGEVFRAQQVIDPRQ